MSGGAGASVDSPDHAGDHAASIRKSKSAGSAAAMVTNATPGAGHGYALYPCCAMSLGVGVGVGVGGVGMEGSPWGSKERHLCVLAYAPAVCTGDCV